MPKTPILHWTIGRDRAACGDKGDFHVSDIDKTHTYSVEYLTCTLCLDVLAYEGGEVVKRESRTLKRVTDRLLELAAEKA